MNIQRNVPDPGDAVFISDPEIMGGRLVFRGTRIPVDILFENLADGMSLDDILDAYPGLTRETAVAAIEIARSAVEKIGRTSKPANT